MRRANCKPEKANLSNNIRSGWISRVKRTDLELERPYKGPNKGEFTPVSNRTKAL